MGSLIAVVAERDKLAEEITREYPPIVAKLVDLVTRLAANDKQREVCNRHARPVHRSFARPRKWPVVCSLLRRSDPKKAKGATTRLFRD